MAIARLDRFAFLLAGWLACTNWAVAGAYPRVLHGQAPAALVGESVVVESPLLQVELMPGIVLSVGAGAVLVLTPAREIGGDFVVTVINGPVLAVHVERGELRDLRVGYHVVGDGLPASANQAAGAHRQEWALPIEALPGYATLPAEQRTHLALGDGIMVRQQEYLDKLKVDVTVINRIVVSIIRGMLPR